MIADAYRRIIAEQKLSSGKALRNAREVAKWLSELGKKEELEELLTYADHVCTRRGRTVVYSIPETIRPRTVKDAGLTWIHFLEMRPSFTPD